MSKLKQFAITFGIAILFTVFVAVTIDAVYQQPEYEDFCQQEPRPVKPLIPAKERNCTFDESSQSCYEQGLTPIYEYDEEGCQVLLECSDCSNRYDTARMNYDRNIFLIIAPIGIAAIIIGAIYGIEFIGIGFMYSGILLLFYSTVRYFDDMNRFLRPVVMLIELGIILWLAYTKVVPKQDENKKKSK